MKLTDSMMPLVAYARQLARSPRGAAAEVGRGAAQLNAGAAAPPPVSAP